MPSPSRSTVRSERRPNGAGTHAAAPSPGDAAGALPCSRRAFLRQGAAGLSLLAGSILTPSAAWGAASVLPPSRRVAVGLIGIGAMGSGHLRRLVADPGFQVVGVCDTDRQRRESARTIVDERYATDRTRGTYRGCTAYNDYRDLVARADLDAVLIATPDHWHALQSIDAAKAGKDVYCEKPISLTIDEGRRVVDAVRRYQRVFQTGTQYRSIPTIRHICRFIREGGLGRVQSVFTLFNNLASFMGAGRFKPYEAILNVDRCGASYVPLDFPLPAAPVPEGLDWDLWVGPAAWRPYHPLYHINPSPGVVPWSFCDSFGATSLTWHLAHSADVIQFALGEERSGPVEIIHPSSGEFPTLTCRYTCGARLHFVDHWGMVKDLYHAVPADARLAGNFGGVFVGERGWITTMSTGGQVEGGPDALFSALNLPTREVNIGSNDHHANWLESMRRRTMPSCDEELGHRTASLGHLANIACTTGRSLRWDPVLESFPSGAAANRLRARTMRPPWRI